jgi:hypothetical protein
VCKHDYNKGTVNSDHYIGMLSKMKAQIFTFRPEMKTTLLQQHNMIMPGPMPV